MKKKIIYTNNGIAFPLKHLLSILKVIRKYHGHIVPRSALRALEVPDCYSNLAATILGMTIAEDGELHTQFFGNEEVICYLIMYKKGSNLLAIKRLHNLCGAIIYRSWQAHKHLLPQESVEENYDIYVNESTCVLFETVEYVFGLIQKGRYRAKAGYKQPTPFSYFLILRLQEVPRKILGDNQIIQIGYGTMKRVFEVMAYMHAYVLDNCGTLPTDEEIAEALHIKRLSTVKTYLDIINRTFVSGDETINSSHFGSQNETGGSIFDIVEDISARFDTGDQLDRIAINEVVRRLGKVQTTIVVMRYGMMGYKVHTDDEIRRVLQIKKKTYNRLLTEAMKALENKLEDFGRDRVRKSARTSTRL